MGIADSDNLTADVERQIRVAIDSAAVVVFLVDVREGIVPLDQEVADRLRVVQKPVVLVANKADTDTISQQTGEFFKLGYGAQWQSAHDQKLGKAELLEAILEKLPPDTGRRPAAMWRLKLAIVGRRNVGKSTFINSLAEAERVMSRKCLARLATASTCALNGTEKHSSPSIRRASARRRLSPVTSSFTACTAPSGRSARRCGLALLRCTTSHWPRRQAARRVRP